MFLFSVLSLLHSPCTALFFVGDTGLSSCEQSFADPDCTTLVGNGPSSMMAKEVFGEDRDDDKDTGEGDSFEADRMSMGCRGVRGVAPWVVMVLWWWV